MAQARSYTVVDTNQTTFYNNTNVISAPSSGQTFYGQDATYSDAQPSYTENSNGTISDNNTGLMWSDTISEEMTWSEAVTYADQATYGGYDDWRLPTIKELYSLMDFSGYSGYSASTSEPYIDDDVFTFEYGSEAQGERVIDAQYWSSTTYTGTTMGSTGTTAFGVNFADGRIKGYPADMPGNNDMETNVILVRGDTSYGVNKFYDNGDGTVTDEATGLMWSSSDSGYAMNWQTALSYAENSTLSGYGDWFLPNAKQLQSIVDYTQSPNATNSANVGPAVNDGYFHLTNIGSPSDPDYGFYWSSTTHVEGGTGDYAAYLSLGTAWGYYNNQWTDVHGAGAQRSDPKYDDGTYPQYSGPQGDLLSIDNYVLISREVADDTTVSGGTSGDGLYGDSGNDVINGNDGGDYLDAGSGRDQLSGGADNDSIYAGAGADTVYGDTGADSIDAGSGADVVYAGADNDYVLAGNYGDLVYGEAGNDIVYGNAGIDWLYGGDGVDALVGGADTDVLYGGADGDWLQGDNAVDYLFGDAGNDTLIGGDGADWFLFNAANVGADWVTDFSSAQGDRLVLATNSTWSATDIAGYAVVTHGGGSIWMSGVSAAQVTSDYFLYM